MHSLVAHGDERDAIAQPAHAAAGKTPRNRADALRIEHDAPTKEKREEDDRHIVVQAAAARNILQQAAAAADEKIGTAHGAEDFARIKSPDGMHAVTALGILRICRDDGDMKFRVQISEYLQHGREHCFIARILCSVVPRYDDPLHRVECPPFRFSTSCCCLPSSLETLVPPQTARLPAAAERLCFTPVSPARADGSMLQQAQRVQRR